METKIYSIIAKKAKKIYLELLPQVSYTVPHKFVGDAYNLYCQQYPGERSTNGRILEYLVCETLAQEGILPFYYQAKFKYVPNADYDLVLYKEKTPVVLSMKVSLRERYKQAGLEGTALQQVHRGARSYLITLSEEEAKNVESKIQENDTTGLTRCVLANRPEYTKLLEELSKEKFELATSVMPLKGSVFPPVK